MEPEFRRRPQALPGGSEDRLLGQDQLPFVDCPGARSQARYRFHQGSYRAGADRPLAFFFSSCRKKSFSSVPVVRSLKAEKLPLASDRAARKKPVHAARASPEPTLIRRTPRSARSLTTKSASQLTNTFT